MLVAVLAFAANFGTFLYAYRVLVVPFLDEEQRVANADLILTFVLVVFALVAAASAFLAWRLLAPRP